MCGDEKLDVGVVILQQIVKQYEETELTLRGQCGKENSHPLPPITSTLKSERRVDWQSFSRYLTALLDSGPTNRL